MKKIIADSPSEEKDPRRLKVLNAAFGRWNDPKLQASYNTPGNGGARSNSTFSGLDKCNVFVFDCLVQAGFASRALLQPGTKNPATAGRWNDPKFAPQGLAVSDVQSVAASGQWTSINGGSGQPQPGDVVSYGAPGAAENNAHATISLGDGWLINASNHPVYDGNRVQAAGVNIKPQEEPADLYPQRTVRSP